MIPGAAKKTGNRQNAFASHTASGSESAFTTVAAALDGGATGMPKKLTASGSVGGLVQIQFGSQAVYSIAVAPNQAPVEYDIPATAFPNKPNSVNVNFEAYGAGTLTGIVDFEVG